MSKSSLNQPTFAHGVRYAYCFAPFISLCLVFGLYAIVYQQVIACPTGERCLPVPEIERHLEPLLPDIGNLPSEVRLNSFAGRITWSLAIGLSLLLSLCAFCWATYLVSQANRYAKRPLWHTAWPLLLAVVVSLFLVRLPAWLGNTESPWRRFVHELVNRDFAGAENWTRAFDMTGFCMAVYVTLALSVYLSSSARHDSRWYTNLSRHIQLLNTTLYLGAILLVVGVFRVWALLYWSLDYLSPTTEEDSALLAGLRRVADGIVNSRGLLYSVMLASLYIPAAMLLQHQLRETKKSGELPNDLAESDTNRLGATDSVLRFIAIIGPALSGPAADYLELFR